MLRKLIIECLAYALEGLLYDPQLDHAGKVRKANEWLDTMRSLTARAGCGTMYLDQTPLPAANE